MITCRDFYNCLLEKGVYFYCGVPDSLLKEFCAFLIDTAESKNHIITANEGNAVGLAAGHYLATDSIGLAYMQNSGLNNALDPLTSLADQEVNSIPVLLMIGWRGEPGKKDEPQHRKQGRITLKLLETLEIPFTVLPGSIGEARRCVEKACAVMREKRAPYALIIREDIFEPYSPQQKAEAPYAMTREEAIELIADGLGPKDVIVATSGKTSRELFEYRTRSHQGHDKDFLTVGSMGHASQIALGIALRKQDRHVYCLDGDGAVIMHMGSLAILGAQAPGNFKHVIINNGAHDSVGGQPTVCFAIDFGLIAKGCGYKTVLKAQTRKDAIEKIKMLRTSTGPSLLEVRVRRGAREDLGRPAISPVKNKNDFMDFLRR